MLTYVGEPRENNKIIWKAEIPLKIKVFMWLLSKNAILTKDNMIKKNWQGDQHCKFCDQYENINHLFFDCSLARYAWSLTAWVIHADCRPTNIDQFWFWCGKYMPRNTNLHMVGLAAFCWSIWLMRNNVCLKKRRLDLLLRSFVPPQLFSNIGQGCKMKRGRFYWRLELKP
jgi:hypothetical protein